MSEKTKISIVKVSDRMYAVIATQKHRNKVSEYLVGKIQKWEHREHWWFSQTCEGYYEAYELRAIADAIDELNATDESEADDD